MICVVSLIPWVLVHINNPKRMNRLQQLCSVHSCAAIAVLWMRVSVELTCHQTAVILHLSRVNCCFLGLKLPKPEQYIAYFFMQKNAVFIVLNFLPSSGSNLCVFITYFQYVHENTYCTTHSTLNYAVALCLENLEKTKDLLMPWNFSLCSVQQYKQV